MFQWMMTSEERRALDLARSLIPPDALRHLFDHGYLTVPSRLHPGRDYHLYSSGTIRVQQGGTFLADLCIHTTHRLPWPDEILTHVLLLEGDEERYLRTANVVGTGMFLGPEDADLLPFNRW